MGDYFQPRENGFLLFDILGTFCRALEQAGAGFLYLFQDILRIAGHS